jgi:transposase
MSYAPKRFVGLDVHKHYVMVGAVNRSQEMILPPRRVNLVEFEGWAKKYLWPTDQVVLEATTNAWYVHDLIKPLVARVVVAHPPHIKLIAAAMVKTDKKDTMTLAKLLAVNLVPPVWVPPEHVRELRGLIHHRRRLISHQTQIKNRLQSLLHRHHIVPPGGKLYEAANRPWWHELDLSRTEKLRVRQDLFMLDQLAGLVKETADEIHRLSVTHPWVQNVPYLIQLTGIGVLTAMTILSAIGDIKRFPTAKKLVGYAGLGARIHASGQTHKSGGITKQGRKELRAALVEAAWIAIRYDRHWQQQFDRLANRMSRHKAIVAIARKMLVVIWHVLSNKQTDRRADPDRVAFSLMTWGWKVKPQWCDGLSTAQFIRYHLLQLGLGHDLDYVIRGNTKRRIAPVAEVITRCPVFEPAG